MSRSESKKNEGSRAFVIAAMIASWSRRGDKNNKEALSAVNFENPSFSLTALLPFAAMRAFPFYGYAGVCRNTSDSPNPQKESSQSFSMK